jgi:catechol-2,3-dioxygenase
MALLYLDHVNLRTANLAGMAEFYCDVLGLREGPRPAFAFRGAWLYCGEHPFVHLVEIEQAARPSGPLALEHFAFTANGFEELLAALTRANVAHRITKLEGTETRQIDLRDPDGNRVHIDFPAHLAK